MKKISLLVLILSFAISCTKDAKTPEGLLRMYVQDLTTKNVDRDYFENYTTGKFKENIDLMTDEDFAKYVNISKVKRAKVSILHKNCNPKKCTLTYLVKYDYVEGKIKTFASEVKKLADVVKVGDVWKIERVSNIKTFHRATQPINIQNN